MPESTIAGPVDRDALYKKIAWRIMPVIFLGYIVDYLDRLNIGFAKLQMLDDLKFSAAVYGFGAGIFFIGYFLFEVPSTVILHKIGARIWIARIMVVWGLVSALNAFVRTPFEFYSVRFILGVAEAGFFPGMVLYLTYWFPSYRRAKMVAILMAGNPVAGIVSGPLSGYILQHFGGAAGLAAWRWLFVIEAVPSVLLGIFIFFYLGDRVHNAHWLSEAQRAAVKHDIDAETSVKPHIGILSVFMSIRSWLMIVILFGIAMGSYAVGFWQPTIISQTGIKSPFIVGLLSMIPYILGVLVMFLAGRHADRTRERRWHVIVPATVAALGFALCTQAGSNTFIAVAGLILATVGVVTALPLFWSLPTAYLSGTAAAVGISLINCTGNLAGFVGPTIIGFLADRTGTLDSGLFLVSANLLLSAVLIYLFVPARLVNR